MIEQNGGSVMEAILYYQIETEWGVIDVYEPYVMEDGEDGEE